MTNSTAKSPPDEVQDVMRLLGDDLRAARRVRKLTMDDMAERVGVTRRTVQRMEAGEPGVSIGNLVTAAWVLDLERNIAEVFAPQADHVGLREARMSQGQRVRKPAGKTLGDFDI